MSATTQAMRERLRRWIAPLEDEGIHDAVYVDDSREEGPTFGDLRALLADADALATCERERDEARRALLISEPASGMWALERERDALRAQVAVLRDVVADAVAICKHDSILAHVAVSGTCGTFGAKAAAALASTAPAVPAERAAEQAAQTEERP